MESKNHQKIFVLIAAAGTASRMGMDTPKQYLKINGKAVLKHTINKLIDINGLCGFVNVINKNHLELYHDAFIDLTLPQYVLGSEVRKQSIYNGLKSLLNVKKNDIILIHDAARPMVQKRDIEKILATMKTANAATLATPITDTLQRGKDVIDRNGLWAVQTPQAFKFGLLMQAHEKFKDDDNFTDDASLIRAMGHDVKIIEGSRSNIKITTQDDFELVKAMMHNERETRTAMGFDVHAFEEKPSKRQLMLGGIHIPHRVALTGHSDADVVLHAITDALLGVINQGDIGTHFPPSDPQWKDVNSAQFLEHAKKLLDESAVEIKFIDVTIMAEKPKIGPHRPAIQKRIAKILDLPESRISIKATTTEKLGFTGRGEGIACQALATATLPSQ